MNKVILMGRLTKAPEIKYLQDDNKTAKLYLKKGTKIVSSGRIRTGSYTDSEGVKRYSSNVVAEEHFFAESKKASDTDPKDEKDGFMSVQEDEELPFE